MYIADGIAYAQTKDDDIFVTAVKPLPDWMMVVTFRSGEKRLFDASVLFSYPAFRALENNDIFMSPKIDHGVITWMNGDIDIAPEFVHAKSYEYPVAE